MVAATEYLRRHNNIAKILHQHGTRTNSLLLNIVSYYKFQPEAVLENANIKIYWKREILTDITISAKRQDVTIFDKKKKKYN